MDKKKIGRRILVEGLIQGIGFRPYVCRLANNYCICGSVKNIGGSVEILAGGEACNIEKFTENISTPNLQHANITCVNVEVLDYIPEGDFAILPSTSQLSREENRLLLPDLSICPDCERELSEDGRRKNHFFNTCVACGPRFSVLRAMPYDRENTSMSSFEMCRECASEYHNPHDRRFHAETISCNNCGLLLLWQGAHEEATGQQAFENCVRVLKNGGATLIKGIGGYHLACSPHSATAVESLRSIKKREQKPFAIMFASVDEAEAICKLSNAEKDALSSPQRPIVLLKLKGENPFAPHVLMNSARCGCLLPYTPLHILLMQKISPLVMTSANISCNPIIKDDEEALRFYNQNPQLGGVLYNNREILRSVEDSVLEVDERGQSCVLRVARSFAPMPFKFAKTSEDTLVLGGDLKSSFCILKGSQAYMSQYLGNLEGSGCYDSFKSQISELSDLLKASPRRFACDLHPGYHSSLYANNNCYNAIRIQHHHAHVASVLAEHSLTKPVLAAAFDGTGYGTDGTVWGGEFFVCKGSSFERVAHLKYSRLVGGDEAARNAMQTALCMLIEAEIEPPKEIAASATLLKSAIQSGVCVKSSSMGRLFDAVAALTGICSENSYEGQCATALQECAEGALARKIEPIKLDFSLEEIDGTIHIGYKNILCEAFKAREEGQGAFALGFHWAVARLMQNIFAILRGREGAKTVVLSGGVFQNSLLLCLSRRLLEEDGFEVYTNMRVPPNDGGIALGQAWIMQQIEG